jgi:caffeoyl-CoA O-methyltransferase
MIRFLGTSSILILLAAALRTGASSNGPSQESADLDARVKQFLQAHRGQWHDLNVPETDGQTMYDIITRHKYRAALEIGTSTGHSGIWIAWALSKNGGRLTTIEIDKERHEEALGHFKEAGVASFIDARLGDAHEIVPRLAGPFDFVFSDADKDWYVQYLKDVLPRLLAGGCFVAHNVSERGWGYNRDFLQYLRSLPQFETTLDSRGAGMSISFRKQ